MENTIITTNTKISVKIRLKLSDGIEIPDLKMMEKIRYGVLTHCISKKDISAEYTLYLKKQAYTTDRYTFIELEATNENLQRFSLRVYGLEYLDD